MYIFGVHICITYCIYIYLLCVSYVYRDKEGIETSTAP